MFAAYVVDNTPDQPPLGTLVSMLFVAPIIAIQASIMKSCSSIRRAKAPFPEKLKVYLNDVMIDDHSSIF